MPLLDHFHAPVADEISWTSLLAGWATRIADDLNDHWLPREFLATELATSGLHPEIDVATYEKPEVACATTDKNGGVAVLPRTRWEVASPSLSFAVTSPK